MRSAVVAVAVSLSIVGLAAANPAGASVRKHTDIPAQDLASALQQLMHDRDLQVIYFSEDIEGLHTQGTAGDLTTDEALNRLLKGTGLSYRYLDEKTVAVWPTSAGRTGSSGTKADIRPGESSRSVDSSSALESQAGAPVPGGGNDPTLWNRFRLVQADTGSPAASAGADRSTETLEEIIVTAQKHEERQQDVPVAMTVLDTKALAENGQNQLVDYFASVPGLSLNANGVTGGMSYSRSGASVHLNIKIRPWLPWSTTCP